MTTKSANILYWVFTVIFAVLMIFSAVGGIQPSQQSIQILHDGLGYPIYFIQFISVAKTDRLHSYCNTRPEKTVKEWAYAGLFFDLAGAVYSGVASSGKFDPMMLSMLIWIGTGILSYYFWHKKMKG
jgi:hypothetical protein